MIAYTHQHLFLLTCEGTFWPKTSISTWSLIIVGLGKHFYLILELIIVTVVAELSMQKKITVSYCYFNEPRQQTNFILE